MKDSHFSVETQDLIASHGPFETQTGIASHCWIETYHPSASQQESETQVWIASQYNNETQCWFAKPKTGRQTMKEKLNLVDLSDIEMTDELAKALEEAE